MVSKRVMALEKRLRVRLLNRNSHRLSLTEPGQLYFERCESILEDLQQAELELESLRSAPSGILRIAFCDRCRTSPSPLQTVWVWRCYRRLCAAIPRSPAC